MLNKSIVPNDFFVPQMEVKYKAFVPRELTKTERDYFWLLPNEINDVIPLILEHNDTGFTDHFSFAEALRSYYNS